MHTALGEVSQDRVTAPPHPLPHSDALESRDKYAALGVWIEGGPAQAAAKADLKQRLEAGTITQTEHE